MLLGSMPTELLKTSKSSKGGWHVGIIGRQGTHAHFDVKPLGNRDLEEEGREGSGRIILK